MKTYFDFESSYGVGPGLGPNYLPIFSVDDKSPHLKKRIVIFVMTINFISLDEVKSHFIG